MADLEQLAAEQAMANEAGAMGLNSQENLGGSPSVENTTTSNSQGILDSLNNGLEPLPQWDLKPSQDQYWDWGNSPEAQRTSSTLDKQYQEYQAKMEEEKQKRLAPFEAEKEMVRQKTLDMISVNLMKANRVSPDDVVQSKEISKTLNVPQESVLGNMTKYRLEYAHRKGWLAAKDNDTILSFMADPKFAMMATDDIEHLGYLDGTVQSLKDFGTGAIEGGGQYLDQSNYASQLDQWFKVGGVKPTEGEQPQNPNTWSYAIGNAVGAFPVQMAKSALNFNTAKKAATGLVVGGGAGSVIPGIGTVAGGIGGVAAGVTAGISDTMAKETGNLLGGAVYDELVKAGVQPQTAFEQAQNARTNSYLSNLALETLSNVVGVGAITKAVTAQTRRAVIAQIAKGAAKNFLEEGTIEAVQATGDNLIKEGAKLGAGTDNIYTDPTGDKFANLFSDAGTNFVVGGAVGGLYTGAGRALGHLLGGKAQETQKAIHQEQVLSDIIDAAGETKTAGRDLETLNAFLQTSLAGTEGETAYLPIEKVQEMAMLHPEAFSKIVAAVPDIDQQLTAAGETGAKVALPTASLVAYLQQDAKPFIPDVSLSADGMSGNEARTVSAELPAAFRQELDNVLKTLTGEKELTPEQNLAGYVFNDVMQQQDNVKYGLKQDRRHIAGLVASRVVSRAKMRGMDFEQALEEYKAKPILIDFVGDETQADTRAIEKIDKTLGGAGQDTTRAAEQTPVNTQQIPDRTQQTDINTLDLQAAAENIPPVDGENTPTNVGEMGNIPTTISENAPDKPTPLLAIEKRTAEHEILAENVSIDNGKDVAPKVQRQPDQELLSEIASKWRDAFSAETNESIDGKTIEEANKIRNYTKITEQEVEALSSLEESFIASISESVGMSQRAFYDAYKLIPHDRRSVWAPHGGYFESDSTGYNVKLHGNDTTSRFATLSHEMGHYFLEVLIDINKLVKNGEILENSVSPKFKETISDLREYFVSNYATLIEKQREKYKQNTQYESYHYLKDIEDNGGAELFGRVFDEGLWISDNEVQKINKIGAVNQSQANKYIKTLQSARSIMHEAFAEGFETYISKGEAPTPRLKELYRWIALWVQDAWNLLTETRKTNDRFGKNADIQKDREFAYNPQLKKIFDDILATQKEQERIASYEQSARGRVVFYKDKHIIQLFKGADPSTLIHELGHIFLEEHFADAEMYGEANPALKEDMQATKDWMKEISQTILKQQENDVRAITDKAERAKQQGILAEIERRGGLDYIHGMIDGGLKETDEATAYVRTMFHEAWARGFERYLMEGIAPNSKMRKAFERFKKLLTDLYQNVLNLGVPLNSNIRGVFDRLLTAERAVEEVQVDLSYTPLLPTLEESGMSKGEYQRYIERFQQDTDNAKLQVAKERLRAISDQLKQPEKLKSIYDRLDKESQASRPVQTLRRMLDKKNDMKLDRATVAAELGEDFASKLPPEVFGGNNMDYRIAAELLGYQKADDLFVDLAETQNLREAVRGKAKSITLEEARKKALKAQAKAEFEAEYDKVNIREQALEALSKEDLAESWIAEMNALSPQVRQLLGDAGAPDVHIGHLKLYARDVVDNMPYDVLLRDEKKWKRAVGTEGAKAYKALSNGDYVGAYRAKRSQILAHLVDKEVTAFKELYAKSERLMASVAKNKALPNVSADHMAIMHRLLQWMGRRTARSVPVSREGLDLPELEYYKSDVEVPLMEALDTFFKTEDQALSSLWYNEGGGYNYLRDKILLDDKKFTGAEYIDFMNFFRGIYTHGKHEQKLLIADRKLELDTIAGQIAQSAEKIRKGELKNWRDTYASRDTLSGWESFTDDMVRFGQNVKFSQLSIDGFADIIDRFNPTGTFNKVVNEVMIGKNAHIDFTKRIEDLITHGVEGRDIAEHRRWLARMNERVPNDKFRYANGELVNFDRRNLIGMAMNFGSPENFKNLVESYGWNPDMLFQFVDKHLEKEDWQFIQALGEVAESNWGALKAKEEFEKGFAPRKVITAPVQTRHGTIDGWYWRMSYEADLGQEGLDEGIKQAKGQKSLKAGSAIERVGRGNKKVTLDILRALGQMQNDSYATHLSIPINQFGKVIKHKEVKNIIYKKMGEVAYRHLLEWHDSIKDHTRGGVMMQDYLAEIEGWLQKGFTYAIFGYHLRPIMDSSVALVTSALDENVNVKDYGAALFEMMHPERRDRFVEQVMEFQKPHKGRNKEGFMNFLVDAMSVEADKSGVSGVRNANVEDQFRQKTARYLPRQRWFEAFKRTSLRLMGWAEEYSHIAAARAAYLGYMRDTPNALHEDGLAIANKVVRRIRTGKNAIDQPLIFRTKTTPYLKFYAKFGNKVIQRFSKDLGIVFAPKDKGNVNITLSKKTGAAFRAMAIPMLTMGLYAYLSGMGKAWMDTFVDEEDSDAEKAAKMALLTAAGGVFGSVPFFRDISEIYTAPQKDKMRAGANLLAHFSPLRSANQSVRRMLETGEVSEKDIDAGMLMFSTAFGSPTWRPFRAGKYIEGLYTGEYDTENSDFVDILGDISAGKER